MKVKPVIDALNAYSLDVELIHTGQHYDEAMNHVFFRDLNLKTPDHQLHAGSGSHAEQTASVMVAFEKLLSERPASAVVVVGDVNSTLACALVGAKAGAVVAHVEAGVRSRDWAMPEEINRVVTDRLSDLLFPPSQEAAHNLAAEGYRPDQIHVVGNVMIDCLLANLERATMRKRFEDYGLASGSYGLVTLHRPSNVDEPVVLEALVDTLSGISESLPLLFAVHPRTQARMKGMPLHDNIRTIEPQGYLDFLSLQAGAALVLTDSGGVQLETTAIGVPCLTLRHNTEWTITIEQGTNRLVGVDPEAIRAAVSETLANPPPKRSPLHWDGKAGERIASVLLDRLKEESPRRPTDRLS